MANDGFAVAVTETGLEYQVRLELARLRLNPYLPQYTRLWTPDKTSTPLVRRFPLFPKYILLPLAEARTREVQYVRGLKLLRPIFASRLAEQTAALFRPLLQDHRQEVEVVPVIEV